MESIFTLASLAPNTVRFAAKFFHNVEREVRSGKIVEAHIQSFAMNNMTKFCELLVEGLTQLRNSSARLTQVNRPPPAKQSRPSVFLNETAVVDALTALLTSSGSAAYLISVSGLLVLVLLKFRN